jgi:hypothetical protein
VPPSAVPNRLRLVENFARIGKKNNACRIWERKPFGECPHEKSDMKVDFRRLF